MSHNKMVGSLALALALLASGAACGSSDGAAKSPSATTGSSSPAGLSAGPAESPSVTVARPSGAAGTTAGSAARSLVGHWKSPADQAGIDADIVDNGIVVTMTGDDGSKTLYWKGTFPEPDGSGTVVSQGDVKAMRKSILGSEAKTKQFHYAGGQILFTITFGDKSVQVRLKR